MKLIKIDAIGSTNDYLKELTKSGIVDDGTLVATSQQTKGRGQMGASWYFEGGKSLAFSIFKKGNNWPIVDQFYVNFAVCVGVKTALDKLGVPKTSIKWPNDILAEEKKVCGILVENQFQKKTMASSVIGIGLNVNNSQIDPYPRASSLLLSSGIYFDLEEVMMTVYHSVMYQLTNLTQDSKEKVHAQYEKYLFRNGKTSLFENAQNVQFEGTIEGVGPEGRLRVRLPNKELKTFELKEIQLRY